MPPLAEQRRIATRLYEQLAEVTRARAAMQAKLEALDRLCPPRCCARRLAVAPEPGAGTARPRLTNYGDEPSPPLTRGAWRAYGLRLADECLHFAGENVARVNGLA